MAGFEDEDDDEDENEAPCETGEVESPRAATGFGLYR
jgi:hypothetical protein